ncbi:MULTISPECIES: hypothetical protein [Streptomyces]|uniref:Uncharacterized protein n=1 Tax=Streptomyces noursei TaxID=1971 RepID=A0A059VT92_STRNR|nr:hypothetical protein [Streptomyces noursei]AKA02866.1 hypothetical protein SAZ_10885 [Streptomyces noursei ZPM]AIA02574.1 hypothetical protein DC74_2064 [Streptomyces noursei]EOS99699.1 hypothetical protein K530_32538 [Streptomyces noursei CCRC 11814]EXU88555.1 hypothetical protein P354_28195 [Streptomyces noursei PD-1]MCE4944301.1 hypothetical protein [Streptomyces noursei]
MTAHRDTDPITADLAELRRLLDVRTATVDGQLRLQAERCEQNTRDADELQARVTRLESRRWPLPSLVALTGLAALAATVWQLSGR